MSIISSAPPLSANTQAAIQATEQGFCVFPCIPGTKRPAVKWRSECEYSSDPAYVAENWPDEHNIGIACGPSGLLVVDLDVKNGLDGIAALRQVVGMQVMGKQVMSTGWPDTYEVSTPSGGRHLYFVNPGHLGNGTGRLPAGIDIRGEGGLVLAAGSVIDGRPYQVVNDADVEELPGKVLDLIGQRPQGAEAPPRRVSRWIGPREARRRAERVLDWLLDRSEGERNSGLHWAACRVGELVKAGGLDREYAAAWVANVAQEIGLEDGEARATIASAFRQAGA
jgi:Bifunctional DNA primase/polymerase, N-terminal